MGDSGKKGEEEDKRGVRGDREGERRGEGEEKEGRREGEKGRMSAAGVWDSSAYSLERGLAGGSAGVKPSPRTSIGGTSTRLLSSPVRIVQGGCDGERFRREIMPARVPVVLRGIIVGQCTSLWSDPEYLIAKGGHKEVSVHVSTEDRMDFISKNFVYRTLPFSELVKRAAYGCGGSRESMSVAENRDGAVSRREDEAVAERRSASKARGVGGGGDDAKSDSTGRIGKNLDYREIVANASQDATLPFFMRSCEKYYLRYTISQILSS